MRSERKKTSATERVLSLMPYLGNLFAVAILCFLTKQLFEIRFNPLDRTTLLPHLSGDTAQFSIFWLLISFALLLVYSVLHAGAWHLLLTVSQKLKNSESSTTFLLNSSDSSLIGKSQTHVPFRASFALFQLSLLGRYLPGKIGQFLGLITLCHRLGIAKTDALIATVLQLAFQCFFAFFVGLPVLLNAKTSALLPRTLAQFPLKMSLLLFIGLVVVIGVAYIFLYQGRFRTVFRKVEYIKRLRGVFSIGALLRVLIVYLLLWGCLGVAFFVFVKSLYPVAFAQFHLIMGTYAVAWLIGVLSVIAPGGLGVREGMLSLLLAICLPSSFTVTVALLTRLWVIGAEVSLGIVALGLYWQRRIK